MNTSKRLELVATSILAMALAATPVLAQSGQGNPERQAPEKPAAKTQLSIVKHDTIIGASVTNGREDDSAEILGSVSDLVLDGRNGHVRYAVLASGGTLGIGKRQTAIPWDALHWDAKTARFALSMTGEAIRKMPEFNPKNLHGVGISGAVDAGSNKGAGTSGAATARADQAEARDSAARGMRADYVLASKVVDCKVLAGKDQLGSAETLFIEPKKGCAAFVTVASGGVIGIGETDYVVPWDALRLVNPIGKQEEVQIQLDKGKDALEAAPKLGDPGADVNKAGFREKVYEFYGVEPPAFEPKSSNGDEKRDGAKRGHGDRR